MESSFEQLKQNGTSALLWSRIAQWFSDVAIDLETQYQQRTRRLDAGVYVPRLCYVGGHYVIVGHHSRPETG
jgi:hypothetical protein